MVTKELLRQISASQKRINHMKANLFYLEEKAVCVPTTLRDTDKVQESVLNNAGKFVVAFTDLRAEIAKKEAVLTEMKAEVADYIDKLPDDLSRKVMRYRYIDCLSWDEITALLGYTWRYLMQIHQDILRDL